MDNWPTFSNKLWNPYVQITAHKSANEIALFIFMFGHYSAAIATSMACCFAYKVNFGNKQMF